MRNEACGICARSQYGVVDIGKVVIPLQSCRERSVTVGEGAKTDGE